MTLQPINAPARYDRSNEQQFRQQIATALARVPDGVAATPVAARMAASETLADGAFASIWSNAGVCELRNADNTDPAKAVDVFVLKGCAAGGVPLIYGPGAINTALGGLTPGAGYWLGTTGGVTAMAPAAEHSGDIVQFVGKALSATSLLFLRGEPTTL
ncbi:MAG TPA: hypothetical protein VGL66_06515 [Caulobacteraceae bacterium]|jgi:hypothetical protein